MLPCLVSFVFAAIILLIIVVVLEAVIGRFIPQYAEVAWLVRLLIGLLLLLYALDCVFGMGMMPHPMWR